MCNAQKIIDGERLTNVARQPIHPSAWPMVRRSVCTENDATIMQAGASDAWCLAYVCCLDVLRPVGMSVMQTTFSTTTLHFVVVLGTGGVSWAWKVSQRFCSAMQRCCSCIVLVLIACSTIELVLSMHPAAARRAGIVAQCLQAPAAAQFCKRHLRSYHQ